MIIGSDTPGILTPILVFKGDELLGQIVLVDTELKIAYRRHLCHLEERCQPFCTGYTRIEGVRVMCDGKDAPV